MNRRSASAAQKIECAVYSPAKPCEKAWQLAGYNDIYEALIKLCRDQQWSASVLKPAEQLDAAQLPGTMSWWP